MKSPNYKTAHGYRCQKEITMVRYVLEQGKKKGHFIGCTSRASAIALTKALLKKRVSAVMHGEWNVMVEPDIPLSEAVHFLRMEEEEAGL